MTPRLRKFALTAISGPRLPGSARVVRHRSAGLRGAPDRPRSVTGHLVGTVPALLGRREARDYRRFHHRPGDQVEADRLRRRGGGTDEFFRRGSPPGGNRARRARRWRLVLLLVPLALPVYKPWGLTPYGRRKQAGQRPTAPP